MTYRPVPNMRGRKPVRINALTNAALIKYLLLATHTVPELAELTGLHYRTVLRYLQALRRAGILHICAWEQDHRGRDNLRVFKLGPGQDLKKSKLTPAQRQQRVRDKRKHLKMIHAMAGAIPAACPA